jgi:hypothetical protein
MEDTPLRIPVVCPECAKEVSTDIPTASIADALATGGPIRLYSPCHERVWQASCLEREQLQAYLEAAILSRSLQKPKSLGPLSMDT